MLSSVTVYPLLHPQQSTSESNPSESGQLSELHSRPITHSLSKSQSPSYILQGLSDEQFIGIVVVEVDFVVIGIVVDVVVVVIGIVVALWARKFKKVQAKKTREIK